MNERLAHCLAWAKNNQTHLADMAEADRLKRCARDNLSTNKRYHSDPGYRLKTAFQGKISDYIRKPPKKDQPIRFGCTLFEFGHHLQGQFKDGMTWENYGTLWEVDHVIPCSHFNLPKEIFQCFHYTNMRPRLIALNRLDGRKAGKWRYLESRDKYAWYR